MNQLSKKSLMLSFAMFTLASISFAQSARVNYRVSLGSGDIKTLTITNNNTKPVEIKIWQPGKGNNCNKYEVHTITVKARNSYGYRLSNPRCGHRYNVRSVKFK